MSLLRRLDHIDLFAGIADYLVLPALYQSGLLLGDHRPVDLDHFHLGDRLAHHFGVLAGQFDVVARGQAVDVADLACTSDDIR